MDEKRPKVNQQGQKELDKVEEQFADVHASMRASDPSKLSAPESEPQVKISNREALATKEHYLKPIHTHSSKEKFNEKYRTEYNYAKTYVPFIAEHSELKGEVIEIWTKPFPGMPAEEWIVPTNRPVWGPRYLAEQIHRKTYAVRRMKEDVGSGQDHAGKYYGQMVIESAHARLDARPVTQNKSIFMGADGS